MKLLQNIFAIFLNLLFPNTCIACKKITLINNNSHFCSDCFKHVKPFDHNLAPELAKVLENSDIDSFNAKYFYTNNIKQTILDFKFYDQPELAKHLAHLMQGLFQDTTNNSILVPVPVHQKRLNSRKYNQASLLAKYIANYTNLEYSNKALERTRNTPHQTGQSAKIRKKQLQDAFLANESIVKNKDIILIDDVFTTGTTAKLCATELKSKGANSVKVVTIAYTAK